MIASNFDFVLCFITIQVINCIIWPSGVTLRMVWPCQLSCIHSQLGKWVTFSTRNIMNFHPDSRPGQGDTQWPIYQMLMAITFIGLCKGSLEMLILGHQNFSFFVVFNQLKLNPIYQLTEEIRFGKRKKLFSTKRHPYKRNTQLTMSVNDCWYSLILND